MKDLNYLKRWTIIFRALANINRLKIVKFLYRDQRLHVSDISDKLGISFKATSNHLALLKNLNVVEAHGVAGHVFYSINQQLASDMQKAINLFQ